VNRVTSSLHGDNLGGSPWFKIRGGSAGRKIMQHAVGRISVPSRFQFRFLISDPQFPRRPNWPLRLFLLHCVGQLIMLHTFGVNSFGQLCYLEGKNRVVNGEGHKSVPWSWRFYNGSVIYGPHIMVIHNNYIHVCVYRVFEYFGSVQDL